MKARRPAALARNAEGVDIIVADITPVFETDGQLEGALHLGQEIRLVNLQQLMQRSERRYGRFADSDRADGIRFYERNVQVRPNEPGNRSCRGPSCGTAPDNDDIFYFCG